MGFEEDYRRYGAALYRLCLGYLRCSQDAEDAVQTAFVRYLQQPGRDAWPDRHKQAWLARTAANCCKDELRRAGRRLRAPWPAEDRSLAGWAGGPGEACPDAAALLARLPARWRRALWLAGLGYTSAEIGARLHCSPATARTWMRRGRQRLRKLAAEGGAADGL